MSFFDFHFGFEPTSKLDKMINIFSLNPIGCFLLQLLYSREVFFKLPAKPRFVATAWTLETPSEFTSVSNTANTYFPHNMTRFYSVTRLFSYICPNALNCAKVCSLLCHIPNKPLKYCQGFFDFCQSIISANLVII